jgi:transcription initiation factor TFIID subunit 15
MGDIPSSSAMVSSIITNPATGDDLDENTDFSVDVQVDNLAAGSFTNPDSTYYSAPQVVDDSGSVVGHTHVTIQSLDDINTSTAPDASEFVFFKGINDAGDGNGGLSADVAGGLPAGTYRVCTMTSASNHQPVIMPVSLSQVQSGHMNKMLRLSIGCPTWCSR